MKTTHLDNAIIGTTEQAGGGFFTSLIASMRKGVADRALHRQLCDMDDALLRDIGLGQDEIYRVRQGGRLTPRSWR